MYVVMGGTGHVGAAAAAALLARGEQVTIITRDASRAGAWRGKVAQIVEDVPSLRSVLRRGRRALLLNPPTDVESEYRHRRAAIRLLHPCSAARDSGSTGGARAGKRIGVLSVLWEFGEGLRHQAVPRPSIARPTT